MGDAQRSSICPLARVLLPPRSQGGSVLTGPGSVPFPLLGTDQVTPPELPAARRRPTGGGREPRFSGGGGHGPIQIEVPAPVGDSEAEADLTRRVHAWQTTAEDTS